MTRELTDPAFLVGSAYATDANLSARQSIYAHQRPKIEFHAWALSHVAWRGDERVVDVGCGNGASLRIVASAVGARNVLGIDLSAGMLASVGPGPALVAGDAQSIPLADRSVDVALAIHVLYHVPRIGAAVAELRRVLRPGGTVVVGTNANDHLFELDAAWREAVRRVAADPGDDPVARSSRRFSLDGGSAALAEAFATVERRDAFSWLWIRDADPVLAYVDSARDFREPTLPGGATWDACREALRGVVDEAIAAEGVFRVRTRAGVFVCR